MVILIIINQFLYGGYVGHVPILFGGYEAPRLGLDPDGVQAIIYGQVRQRIYIDQAQTFASYPFTTTRRLEVSGGFTRYGFDYEVDRIYEYQNGLLRRERTNLDSLEPDPIYFGSFGLAMVSDYSFFAMTSPVRGGRSRIGVTPYIGSQNYIRVLADLRQYVYLKPFTLAVRGLHVGNYGVSSQASGELFTSEYLGYTNGRGFVRGYGFSTFDGLDCSGSPEECFAEQNRLIGTRIAIASAEFRIPLLGSNTFGILNFPYLPTEVTFFVDGGMAWTADDAPRLEFVTKNTVDRIPVFSTGVTTRFNLFGYLVLEVFYAKPFQRPGKGAHFGFQLVPGW